MRGRHTFFVLLAVGIASVVSGPAASAEAPPPAGLHGEAVRDFSPFPGQWRFSLNVTQLPTGGLAGDINFFAIGTPTVDFGFYQATPVFFTVDGNTACVVGVITHLQNLPPASEPRPLYTLFKV